MNFTEAFELLKDGVKIKRKDWGGYWMYCKESDEVLMHCKNGDIIDIRDTHDILFTLGNMASTDWEIANEINCKMLSV